MLGALLWRNSPQSPKLPDEMDGRSPEKYGPANHAKPSRHATRAARRPYPKRRLSSRDALRAEPSSAFLTGMGPKMASSARALISCPFATGGRTGGSLTSATSSSAFSDMRAPGFHRAPSAILGKKRGRFMSGGNRIRFVALIVAPKQFDLAFFDFNPRLCLMDREKQRVPPRAASRAITHSQRRPAARVDMPHTAARKKPAAKDEVSFIKRKRGGGPPRLRHIAASSASSELNSCSSLSSDDLRVWIAQRKIWLAFGRSSSPNRTTTLSQTEEARTRPMGPGDR
jgi:hypothetical protein